MKEPIKREDARSIESYVDRLEQLLARTPARQHKIGHDITNNVAGFNTKHLPNFSTSNIIDSQLWKKESGQ